VQLNIFANELEFGNILFTVLIKYGSSGSWRGSWGLDGVGSG
jgi:hypothetical protein